MQVAAPSQGRWPGTAVGSALPAGCVRGRRPPARAGQARVAARRVTAPVAARSIEEVLLDDRQRITRLFPWAQLTQQSQEDRARLPAHKQHLPEWSCVCRLCTAAGLSNRLARQPGVPVFRWQGRGIGYDWDERPLEKHAALKGHQAQEAALRAHAAAEVRCLVRVALLHPGPGAARTHAGCYQSLL